MICSEICWHVNKLLFSLRVKKEEKKIRLHHISASPFSHFLYDSSSLLYVLLKCHCCACMKRYVYFYIHWTECQGLRERINIPFKRSIKCSTNRNLAMHLRPSLNAMWHLIALPVAISCIYFERLRLSETQIHLVHVRMEKPLPQRLEHLRY